MSHCSSQEVAASALYSASVEDLLTVTCFLDFQEINQSPMKMQNPVIDLLVSGQVAQSESLKALSCSDEVDGKKSPKAGDVLIYRRTLMAAS